MASHLLEAGGLFHGYATEDKECPSPRIIAFEMSVKEENLCNWPS